MIYGKGVSARVRNLCTALRKTNTRDIAQANKVMHLAAVAYNLKKYLKFTQELTKSGAKALALIFNKIRMLENLMNVYLNPLKFS